MNEDEKRQQLDEIHQQLENIQDELRQIRGEQRSENIRSQRGNLLFVIIGLLGGFLGNFYVSIALKPYPAPVDNIYLLLAGTPIFVSVVTMIYLARNAGRT